MIKSKIGFYTATALVVASMIGTGVFTSLGFQSGSLPSVTVLLLLWLVGGLLAICGGLSYVELSRLYPGSGGEYHYIKQAFHPLMAKVAGLVSIFAGFTAPIALAAMAFGFYLHQLLPFVDARLAAAVLVTTVAIFHCFTLKLASGFQLVSTSLKLLLLFVFILFGLWNGKSHLDFEFDSREVKMLFSSDFLSSLVYVSFAYSGWNASTYIFSEIKDPQKNIRRSVIIGTLLVTLLYLLLNLVFLKVLPIVNITGIVEIGALAAKSIFGEAGGTIISGMISLLLVSTVSALVWIGPRIIMKIGKDESIKWLSRTSPTGVPLRANVVQYLIVIVFIVTGSFKDILGYASIGLNVCSCIAIAALFLNYGKINKLSLIPATIFIIVSLFSSYYLL